VACDTYTLYPPPRSAYLYGLARVRTYPSKAPTLPTYSPIASREGVGAAHASLPPSQAAPSQRPSVGVAEVQARLDASAAEAARQWAEAEAEARSFVAEFDGAAAYPIPSPNPSLGPFSQSQALP
jgi:hypothetical protein